MTVQSPTRILLAGAGAIGRLHFREIQECKFCKLSGIVEPTSVGQKWAEGVGVPWFADLDSALAHEKPDAAIVATPNHTHRSLALHLIEERIVTLVEKPIAGTIEDASEIATASEKAGVPVLVGHHRRHNPIIRNAHEIISRGASGQIVSVSLLALFHKPEEYFKVNWRREPGGGPILINLIHEIDVIRHLCGEISSVHAMTSNRTRSFEVEDTAAVLLRLDNGALVTISLSDCVSSPWSWDLQVGEIDSYPAPVTPVTTMVISGTEGSISLPSLDFWSYRGKPDWYEPLTRETTGYRKESPYIAQLSNLCAVSRGEAVPVVDAREGLRTLRATLAVAESARTGKSVHIPSCSFE
ncbi:Gfo/Idh/MocA family oxidoreductase [Acetobacter senegalensis]|uniref:Gfo/Idh/MocA family protein n=1 Tax=Acetobacter senegalensis TaxID=446692 RepID=UPI00209C7ABD|nr:Gfo/Idh/MocA family oxidoreductase [Acetobacter senegalensis]MCP1196048.1 Gfo/Idh/MocA family oxidoreductase [Acetobacter senegalensis]